MSDGLHIREAFPPPDLAAWRALVERDLKGASFEKLLVARTLEGIDLQPLYTRADGEPTDSRAGFPGLGSLTRGGSPLGKAPWGWTVAVDLPHGAPAAAAAALREDTSRGVTGVNLSLPRDPSESMALLGEVLRGQPAGLSVYLDGGPQADKSAAELSAAWDLAGVAPQDRRGSYGGDPLGVLARTGQLTQAGGREAALTRLGGLCHFAASTPHVRAIEVRADLYHDAGAHAAQDLGFGVATGIAYLRALDAHGLPVSVGAQNMGFTFAVGPDLFMGIAKLRAARRLWSRVVSVSGGDPEAARAPIHARAAWRMLAANDPMVNTLRSTLSTFAAAVGGADRISVPPHDAVLREDEPGSRRLARNVQLILRGESHLHRVIDPAGGSYYVEALTDRLAEEAWGVVQAVESRGGMADALGSGWVAQQLDATRARRGERVSKRKDAIVGVSSFPDLSEPPRAARSSRIEGDEADGSSSGLTRQRLAEPFEHLRQRSDARLLATGSRPPVFLASMGPLATHNPRTTWVTNLLAAGGFEAVGAGGYESAEAAAAALRESGAHVAVICSSDALYAERVPTLAPALRAAGAGRIVLAGRPADEWTAVGVDSFVHIGVDVVDFLRSLWEEEADR